MTSAYLLEKIEESDLGSLSLFGRRVNTKGNKADPTNAWMVKILSNTWAAVYKVPLQYILSALHR